LRRASADRRLRQRRLDATVGPRVRRARTPAEPAATARRLIAAAAPPGCADSYSASCSGAGPVVATARSTHGVSIRFEATTTSGIESEAHHRQETVARRSV